MSLSWVDRAPADLRLPRGRAPWEPLLVGAHGGWQQATGLVGGRFLNFMAAAINVLTKASNRFGSMPKKGAALSEKPLKTLVMQQTSQKPALCAPHSQQSEMEFNFIFQQSGPPSTTELRALIHRDRPGGWEVAGGRFESAVRGA
jgi:hypothetical protein